MNIHEYQAKELFEKYGVASPNGQVAGTAEEAEAAARAIIANGGGKQLVIKAQVHAGGRGKGTFKNGFQGGVHLVESPEQVAEFAEKMIGQTLVTKQTGEEGKLVSKVMIAEAVDIERELYLAILMDRETCRPVIVASTEGGMDIEEVAESTPDKIVRQFIHPLAGLQGYEVRKLAKALELTGDQAKQFGKLIKNLYSLFLKSDCSMVEINPLVVTPDGDILALAYRDTDEEDPREVEASKFDLNYIGLDGDIACLVNGAGLAMATMDIIKHYGGDPANFLDVGGGASKEQVSAAFKIILGDPKVKGILVNIFGGIMQCDIIAEGILAAAKETGLSIPLIVRLEGTNVDQGRELIANSDLDVITAESLNDAAQKAVAAVSA